MAPPENRKSRRRKSRRGSELVESMFMMLPFFALVFLMIDTCYGIFIKATLQYAVQAGASFAATDSSQPLTAGIQSAVQAASLNLVSASNVSVSFSTPTSSTDSNNQATMTMVASSSGTQTQAGNVVQISASYSFNPLAPLFRSSTAIPLTATAGTVLTATPGPPL